MFICMDSSLAAAMFSFRAEESGEGQVVPENDMIHTTKFPYLYIYIHISIWVNNLATFSEK